MAASMAMMQGSKAGLAEANKRSTDDNSFKETARTAGEMLMNMRQYPQAADFLQAARPATMPRAHWAWPRCCAARGTTRICNSRNTPADVVKRFALVPFDPNLTKDELRRDAQPQCAQGAERQGRRRAQGHWNSGKKMNSELAREDSSLDVTEDMLLQMLDPKGEGDDATGYREKVQILGGKP